MEIVKNKYMNTFIKLLILGTAGTGGVLASGFINIRLPSSWIEILDRVALAWWSIDGIVDASFDFNCLYFLAVFELCVICFLLYKWILSFVK